MAASWNAILAFASAVPLVLIGASLLALRPRRREQVSFGIFGILWGLQVATANLGRIVPDARIFATSYLVSTGIGLAMLLALVHFASSVALARQLSAPSIVAVVLVAAAAGALVYWPQGFLASVEESGRTTAGILAFPLHHLPFYAAFYVAIALLAAEYTRTPFVETRRRARAVLLALAAFASFVTTRLLFIYLDPPANLAVPAPWGTGAYLGLFAAGEIVLLGSLAFALRARGAGARPGWVVAAFAIPAAWAVVEGTLQARGFFVDTVGLWRIVAVGVIVHALARYRLFDIDLKIKIGLQRGTVAAIFVGTALIVTGITEAYLESSYGWVAGGLAAGALTLLLHPLQRVASRVADRAMPGVSETPSYVAYRKMQVYRSALEGVLADGNVTAKERATLARLAGELGIPPADAAALEEEVRTAAGFATRPGNEMQLPA